MDPSLPELIRRARTLCAERDRLVERLADRWATVLRDQRLSRGDLEELWGGLIEEAVRGVLRDAGGRWTPEATRQEAVEVVARLRLGVERALAPSDDARPGDE